MANSPVVTSGLTAATMPVLMTMTFVLKCTGWRALQERNILPMSLLPRWRFREMQPGEINIDPIEEEFFTTEALGSLNDALVREAIQNSLDAAAGDGPVTVRFSFHSLPATGASSASSLNNYYLDGIGPHLLSRYSGLQGIPSLTGGGEYLLIEDYGTRGLQGDIFQEDDLDDAHKRNDFFYFWRNIGRTSKGEADLGRWGLGKTVFQAASQINSFIGLTVRHDDQQCMLMGQAVLKIHKVNGRRYAPYGFFGRLEKGLPLPVTDSAYLADFANDFKIDRLGKPGLSILVPFLDADIQPMESVKSVIKHYFFPILADRLIFQLCQDGKVYTIDATSLEAYLKRSKWTEKKGLLGLIDLARWSIRQPPEAYLTLNAPPEGRVPKLTGDLFPEGLLDKAARHFGAGRRLAVRVPLSLQRKDRKKILPASFQVFLEKDPDLERAEDTFIRQGITIPEISYLKHKGIRAIVSITDVTLSTFLGDAENPAHTDWERNSRKFKLKYIRGRRTLDFVKTSPRELARLLTQPKKGRDENLLKHLFALSQGDLSGSENHEAADRERGDVGQGGGDREGGFVGIEGAHYIQLRPIKGGFRLTRRPQTTKVPRVIVVWVAYDVRSGNPFKMYTPLDFNLSQHPVQVHVKGAELMFCSDNAIQIRVQRGDFNLSVTGFDPHRDLRVKTHP